MTKEEVVATVAATDAGARLPEVRAARSGRAGAHRHIKPRTVTAGQRKRDDATAGGSRLAVARYDSAAARAGPALTGKGFGGATVAEAKKEVFKAAVERARRETVRRALEEARGNVAEAASSLGILRTSLYRIMKRYGIASSSCDGR